MTREAFEKFVAYCHENIHGDEKGEAQLFLEHFFVALGHEGTKEAGASFEHRIRNRERNSTDFADLLWPGRVLIEMKKRGQDLRLHLQQAATYWQMLARDRPRYIMLCNFDEFWIYDFDQSVWDPVEKVTLENLPDKKDVFSFLFPVPKTPVFGKNRENITSEAAQHVSVAYRSMIKRGIAQHDALRFCLQMVLSFFAEDTGLLPSNLLSGILDELSEEKANGLRTIEKSYDLIGGLFREMNTPGVTPGGRYKGTEYFDGGLFDMVLPIELTDYEIAMFRVAGDKDWKFVNPAIFGSIFENAMEGSERHKLGAHYTHELDIKKIVGPVIVQPWNEKINKASGLDDYYSLLDELVQYRVLDPACGSGNFLFVAFREMKLLEQRLLGLVREHSRTRDDASRLVSFLQSYPYVSTRQFFGIDLNPFSVELARVTLMIAKELTYVDAGREDHDNKHLPLPLDNLDQNILCADALLNDEGEKRQWPDADAIIGNPPYQSKNKMQQEFGVEYLNKLRKVYPEIPGRADFCVYWYFQAHRQLKPGCMAGLVGTNTIRQNYSREGSLDYIVKNGGTILNAVSSEKWSGEAAVFVSIVNWIKGSYEGEKLLYQYNSHNELEALRLPRINSSLSPAVDVSSAKVLRCNREPKKVFQGQTHGHEGFLLPKAQAERLLKEHPEYAEVLKPFLIGDELVSNVGSEPERYVIDFTGMDVVTASKYSKLFSIIEQKVLPDRQAKAEEQVNENRKVLEANPKAKVNKHHINFLNKWWQLSYGREDMLKAISGLSHYIACARVTQRPIFELISSDIHPNDKVMCFAYEDFYSFGIIQSNLHWQWFLEKCTTLAMTPNYNSAAIWDTFPWPQHPTPEQVSGVEEAAMALHEARTRMMHEHHRSLRDLYRLLEKPGKNELRDLHQSLDKAVTEAYGFNTGKDLLAQLLQLNLEVAEREEKGMEVRGPGQLSVL